MDLYNELVKKHGKAQVWKWNNQEVLDKASELLESFGEEY